MAIVSARVSMDLDGVDLTVALEDEFAAETPDATLSHALHAGGTDFPPAAGL